VLPADFPRDYGLITISMMMHQISIAIKYDVLYSVPPLTPACLPITALVLGLVTLRKHYTKIANHYSTYCSSTLLAMAPPYPCICHDRRNTIKILCGMCMLVQFIACNLALNWSWLVTMKPCKAGKLVFYFSTDSLVLPLPLSRRVAMYEKQSV